MSTGHQLKKYLQYILRSVNEHSIHSPFVYTLYIEVISNKNKKDVFNELNKIREELLNNNETIEVTDLGAGSKKMSNTRKISDIAKHSVVNKKYGELIFRLTEYFKPKTILELGTSLGLSSLYLVKAAPNAKITSIEGCPNTYRFARSLVIRRADPDSYRDVSSADSSKGHETLKRVQGDGKSVIELINSSFDEFFDSDLQDLKFDLVYIDGNHTYEATVKYFDKLLALTDENSVLIFDDIYWSEGMTKAWEEIKAHPSVRVTIDLYKIGLVFFRKENKQKEDFLLRF